MGDGLEDTGVGVDVDLVVVVGSLSGTNVVSNQATTKASRPEERKIGGTGMAAGRSTGRSSTRWGAHAEMTFNACSVARP